MTEAVRLFEVLYDFRRAVEILVNNNKFDAAIDVLKRYQIFNKVISFDTKIDGFSFATPNFQSCK